MKAFDKVILGSLGALVLGLGVVGVVVANQPQEAKAATGDTFTLVTNASTLAAGDTVTFGYVKSSVGLFAGIYVSGNFIPKHTTSTGITISSNSFETLATVEEYTLGGSSSGWTFTPTKGSVPGVLYVNANKTLTVAEGTTNSYKFTITVTTAGVASITNLGVSGAKIQYNTSSPRFAAYTSSQGAISLFKKTSSAKALSSIAITGTATKNRYCSDESFDPTGLTVTATYDDGTTADVTSQATWSSLVAGSNSVTASVTAGGVTKTADYSGLTVTAAPSYSLVSSMDALSYGADVIVADAAKNVVAGAFNSTDSQLASKSATIADNAIATSQAQIFALGYAGASNFTFKDQKTSQYLAAASSSNNTVTENATLDSEGQWSIAIAETTYKTTITAQGDFTHKVLGHYSTSAYFACYTGLDGTIQLYQKANYTLTSLAVSGSLTKASYYDNEAFDPSGLTATATFTKISDNSTLDVDVTSRVSWPTSHLAAGTTSVNGTFVSGGVTKTIASPAISVAAVSLTSIEVTTQPTKVDYEVNEAFSTTGMVVTGHYNNGSTAVTADYTIDPANGATLSTIGSITVTVSATGVSSVSFVINVTAAPAYNQVISGSGFGTSGSSATLVQYQGYAFGNLNWYVDFVMGSGNAPAVQPSTTQAQIGTNSSYCTSFSMESSLFVGAVNKEYLISKVIVNAKCGSGSTTTLAVSVDGTAFGNAATLTSSGYADYTFTGSKAGHVKLAFTNDQKALYIDNIKIYATAPDGETGMCYGVAADLEKINTCSVTSTDWGTFKAKTAELGTYAEVVASYGSTFAAINLYDLSSASSLQRNAGVTAKAKYDAIEARFAGSSAFDVTGMNDAPAIVAVAALGILGLLTTAGVFLLKKKHN